MTAFDRNAHWQGVYSSKAETEVSWFEQDAALSLALIEGTGLGRDGIVIDVGGGASRLVDALLARGQAGVSVLDISAEALAVARRRLGAQADAARWIVSDITAWVPDRAYDLWHDRAAFHFLTEPADQQAYRDVLDKALKPGGHATIGTFAPDGPEKCSNLPVARHDAASIGRILGPGFKLVETLRHDHRTPWDSVQKFQFSIFRKA